MMNFLRKHMRKIFIITILGFVAGIFMGFGSYFFQKEDYKTAGAVNDSKISLALFNFVYLNALETARNSSEEEPSEEAIRQLKIRTLQELIMDEIFYQQSANYGIVVSDRELKTDIQNTPMFRDGGNNNVFDIRMYRGFLQTIKMSPKEYETIRKKQIAGEKLKILLASSVKLINHEYNEAVKADSAITKEMFLYLKTNALLNEWYQEIIRNSKISSSSFLFAK